jgi:hypothetical protein
MAFDGSWFFPVDYKIWHHVLKKLVNKTRRDRVRNKNIRNTIGISPCIEYKAIDINKYLFIQGETSKRDNGRLGHTNTGIFSTLGKIDKQQKTKNIMGHLGFEPSHRHRALPLEKSP